MATYNAYPNIICTGCKCGIAKTWHYPNDPVKRVCGSCYTKARTARGNDGSLTCIDCEKHTSSYWHNASDSEKTMCGACHRKRKQ